MANHAGIPLRSKGGYVAVYDYDSDTFIVLDNSSVEHEATLALNGLTISGMAGWETGIHKNNTVSGILITLPEDEPSSVESNALQQNRAYDLWVRRGSVSSSSVRFDLFELTIYKGIAKRNDTAAGTKRMVTLMFEKGRYSPSLPASSDLLTYLQGISRES